MTKPTPQDRKKTKPHRILVIIALLLAIFATALVPPRPALAQCVSVCDVPQTAIESAFKTGNLQILGTIFTAVSGLFNFISGAFTTFTKQGFSAVSSAVAGANMINVKMQEMTANFGAQTAMYVPQVVATAEGQARATLPAQSNVCAIVRYEQAMERLGRRDQLSGAESFISANDGKGINADCDGPKRKRERLDDLCQLGLMNKAAYGTLLNNCKDPPDQSYADRYKNLAIFLNNMQMPLATPCILADGYPSFAGVGACQGGTAAAAAYNADPSKSQLAWVAAYKLCEGMADMCVTPAAGTDRQLNSVDVDTILASGSGDILKGGARKACLKALFDRTACPAGVDAKAIGFAETCHDDQVAVCQALKGQPNAAGAAVVEGDYPAASATDGGVGLGSDAALQNCEQDGLSIMKIKEIKAHPCADLAYVANHGERLGDSEKLESFANDKCSQMSAAFEHLLAQEEVDISNALNTAASLRTNGVGTAGSTTPGAR